MTKLQVAAAPEPLPLACIVTVGIDVYPDPGLINNISLMEQTSPLHVVIATADAVIPPVGAGVNETVGIPT